MVRFYFMRHGETRDNVKQLCSTQPNSDADLQNGLTAQGILQCKAAGTAFALQLQNNSSLRIIHSGTLRTKQSGEELIKALEDHIQINITDMTIHEQWRERDYGAYIGKPYHEFQSIPHENYAQYEVENDQSFKNRIQKALQLQKNHPNNKTETLIISHGGCWDMLCQEVGISPIPWIENAEIFLVNITKPNKKNN
jgi:broad specificity phosphatase PhoE